MRNSSFVHVRKLKMKRQFVSVLATLLASAALLPPFAAKAATGDPDSFNPNPDADVFAIALQRDGNVLFGGDFNHLGTAFGQKIARVSGDGSRDATFTPGVAPTVNGRVYCTAVQSDGKVLLGGIFTSVAGWPRTNLARVNADGTMDFGFSSAPLGAPVSALALQPDGKLVVGGPFTTVRSVPRNSVARLATNGPLE